MTQNRKKSAVIEVFIYFLCFVIGGPLNVISLRRSLRAFSQHKAKSPILLLRINLNLADLCTLFVYVPKQIIWMLTYQVSNVFFDLQEKNNAHDKRPTMVYGELFIDGMSTLEQERCLSGTVPVQVYSRCFLGMNGCLVEKP
ncbi:unnamed protein product [Nippostrongylus brasiliensis]|uniref:G_PROTEIN_RECEP_F1_2 domain-containing protein n=1 Tax=Nippostrongylus brasiliensis TaxID=27835 RepID=A0A0N4XDI1_NIPBR|nr:unnamed protein product [Nippostrongylus brasiliensis]